MIFHSYVSLPEGNQLTLSRSNYKLYPPLANKLVVHVLQTTYQSLPTKKKRYLTLINPY